MLISISPPLSQLHQEKLQQFCHKEHNPLSSEIFDYIFSHCTHLFDHFVCVPSKRCNWCPTDDGCYLSSQNVSALDTVSGSVPFLQWLVYLINRFLHRWGYSVNGYFLVDSTRKSYCTIRNNVVSIGDRQSEAYCWIPKNDFQQVHNLTTILINKYLLDRGVTDWKIVLGNNTDKSTINLLKKTVSISQQEFNTHCRMHGLKNLLYNIETRILTSSQMWNIDKPLDINRHRNYIQIPNAVTWPHHNVLSKQSA